ncbi:MAG: response regulator [Chloroflexota bacterium]
MESEDNKRFTFLVVDDDQSVSITLKKVLELDFPQAGVITAGDGAEGWNIVKERKPEIVLCDLSMPREDGMQLLARIRNQKNLEGIFFIMMTGNTDNNARVEAMARGADDFLIKPIMTDMLRARINSALRIINMQAQLLEENKTLQNLADELEKYAQDITKLAVKFMDARIPNSFDSLRRIAEASVWIARQLNKFDEQELREIEVAAYLSQSGRLFLPDNLIKTPVLTDGLPTSPLMYQVPVAARDIVASIRRFENVGKIIYHIYENVDGTGFPERLKSWQIPLQSRIIRVPLDFEDHRKRSGEPSAEIMKQIASNSNRFYDHRVVILLDQYLFSVVKEDSDPNQNAVLLSDLVAGMLLKRDIVTTSGMKLMPAGAILTQKTIERLLSHNSSDPILGSVWVKK